MVLLFITEFIFPFIHLLGHYLLLSQENVTGINSWRLTSPVYPGQQTSMCLSFFYSTYHQADTFSVSILPLDTQLTTPLWHPNGIYGTGWQYAQQEFSAKDAFNVRFVPLFLMISFLVLFLRISSTIHCQVSLSYDKVICFQQEYNTLRKYNSN